MSHIILKLNELSCPSCLAKIENALAKLPGVTDGKVLFNASKVKADFDPEQISPEKIASTIEKLGYPVQSTKVTD